MTQFGIPGSPALAAEWKEKKLLDDPSASISNSRSYVSFATSGKDSRTTQMFINLADNANLDGMVSPSAPLSSLQSNRCHPPLFPTISKGFTPFARVTEGMVSVRCPAPLEPFTPPLPNLPPPPLPSPFEGRC